MTRAILASACALLLAACVTLPQDALDPIDKTESYATCAEADLVTSGLSFATGVATEGNATVRALAPRALGPIFGPVVSIAVLAYITFRALTAVDEPLLTAAYTGGTCAIATRNALILLGGKL